MSDQVSRAAFVRIAAWANEAIASIDRQSPSPSVPQRIEFVSMAPFEAISRRMRELSEHDWIEGRELASLLDDLEAATREQVVEIRGAGDSGEGVGVHEGVLAPTPDPRHVVLCDDLCRKCRKRVFGT